MKSATQHRLRLGRREIDCRLVRSPRARKLRIRVSPDGVDVITPASRANTEAIEFLHSNRAWVADQLNRVERLLVVRRSQRLSDSAISFRGEPVRVSVRQVPTRARGNMVALVDDQIVIWTSKYSRTPIERSLETWLRGQARVLIEAHLEKVTQRLRQRPQRVYVMGQRTKWGNCSARRNLSFNWRLIFAPDFVLRYIVTHEAAHLAVPDHSSKFWLTVQGLCHETEKARRWLSAYGHQLGIDLGKVTKNLPR